MKPENFDALSQTVLVKCAEVLSTKEEDYGSEADRLIQFKQMAVLQENTPRQALWGAATKHLTTIMDAVQGRELKIETIQHRVTDFINYLILLLAIVEEEAYDFETASQDVQDREDTSSELRGGESAEGSGGEGRPTFVKLDTTELPGGKI